MMAVVLYVTSPFCWIPLGQCQSYLPAINQNHYFITLDAILTKNGFESLSASLNWPALIFALVIIL